jgi:hypothetical protein
VRNRAHGVLSLAVSIGGLVAWHALVLDRLPTVEEFGLMGSVAGGVTFAAGAFWKAAREELEPRDALEAVVGVAMVAAGAIVSTYGLHEWWPFVSGALVASSVGVVPPSEAPASSVLVLSEGERARAEDVERLRRLGPPL